MMKRTILTTGLIAFAFSAFAQFTADRLVVSQIGDGAEPLVAMTSAPMILKEFPLTGGASTYSLTMPIAASGANNPLTGKGNSNIEGLLTLSPNGTYLTAVGYAIAPGALIDGGSAKTNRVVGLINGAGVINTTTSIVTSSANLLDPRSAITLDGTGFWINFNGNGVRYLDLGATATTAVQSSPLSVARSVNIFNDQLYYTTNSSAAPHVGTITAAASGNKLPKSTEVTNANTAPVALPGTVISSTEQITIPNQVVFLKSTSGAGNPDIFYVANNDIGNEKVEKWVFNSTSNVWEAKGSVPITGNLKGITARIVDGTAHVYVNTETEIISITDPLAISSVIADATNARTVLATAPTNTIFKGIALTPGSKLLPIKLSSFTGKRTLDGAQLTWTTASEKNNLRFDILKSTDGKAFAKIGEVAGSENSDATLRYSYLDRNPSNGANYYKLNQVDKNGTSEEFGPIVLTVNDQSVELTVYANRASGQIKVNIYASKPYEATLRIQNANGSVVAVEALSLKTGSNEVILNSKSAGAGLHIASITIDGVALTKKFVFQ